MQLRQKPRGWKYLFAFFICSNAFSQTVTLISPNGLQRWEAGSQRMIMFSASSISDIRIEYSSNNGAAWSDIVASTPAGSGMYQWSLPMGLSDLAIVRVSSVTAPSIADQSDRQFAIVPARPGSESDFIFFSDSPAPNFYDPSWGFANAPSTVDRIGDNKFPVSIQYSLVGNYALRLQWTSRSGGDWGMAVAGIGWPARDTFRKDSLVFYVLSPHYMLSGELPLMYLEDVSNRKTARLPLRNFVGAVGQELWRRVAIPLQAFRDNPGQADLSQIKTVFFGQDVADETPHTWYIDDIRMVGTRPFSDSLRVIAVLGSSSAAGVGPSTVDSAWVWRYRRYVNSFDSSARVVNFAVGGYTTYDVMPTGFAPPAGRPTPKVNNNISAALAYHPNAIIVALPTNDVAYGYAVAEQLRNFDTLRTRSQSANVPIWITTSGPRNITDPVQRSLLIVTRDSIFSRYSPRVIDIWTGIAASDGTILPQYNAGDGIHLNDAAHAIMFQRVVATRIWEAITSIERSWQIPEAFLLRQNFPNPFNPETTINFVLAEASQVELKVYDVLGRDVSTLVNEAKPAGEHSVSFNARNLSSGVYYYKLRAGAFSKTNRMILTK